MQTWTRQHMLGRRSIRVGSTASRCLLTLDLVIERMENWTILCIGRATQQTPPVLERVHRTRPMDDSLSSLPPSLSLRRVFILCVER